ncbi:uncharacterized protein [Littorina saxatilis]|uniref:Uncharacterized protein n=1 Tax=Littorina saxatilis TaxID=31220 RepID=A0AAN9GN80_9CAEN
MLKAEMGMPFSYPVVVASEDDYDINDCPHLLAAMETLTGCSNLNLHVDVSAAGIQSPTPSATMTKANILGDQGKEKLGVKIRGGEIKIAPPSKSHVICQNLNSSSFFDDMSKGTSTFTAGTVSLLGQYRGKSEESVDRFVCFTARVLITLAYLTCMYKPFTLTLRHVFALVKHLLCFLFMVLCLVSSQTVTPKPWTLVILSALFCQGSAGLVTSNQKFLPVCVRSIESYDCPIKSHSLKEWKNMNKTCCSGFPGTVLVCQKGHDLIGNSYNFPACLPDKLDPPGNFGNLSKDDRDNPVFLVLPCNATTEFEDKERLRSDATFPQCRRKSKCDGEGQELLCKSDSMQDDLCTCAEGFFTTPGSCEQGFTQHDHCNCHEKLCHSGLVPARTTLPPEPRLCSELICPGFAVQSRCIKPTTTPVPSTPPPGVTTALSTATEEKGPAKRADTTPAVPYTPTPPEQPHPDKGDGELGTTGRVFRGLTIAVIGIYFLWLFLCVLVAHGYIGRN